MTDRPLLEVDASPRQFASWRGIAIVSAELGPDGWVLAGGQMVALHLNLAGPPFPRVTVDADAIIDVRARPDAARRASAALLAAGWDESGVDDLDNYQAKMDVARGLAREALEGLRALHADNTVNDALIGATTLSHQATINLSKTGSFKIEGIDEAEVAAKLDVVQLQLQATFAAVGTTNQLSLVNFLA